MKTLYLLRHAKAERPGLELSDSDRPLNERGYADAHLVGKHLFSMNIKPDLIISSPAIRALSTALIVSDHLNYQIDNILIGNQLYDSDPETYLDCISKADDSNSLLLTGHNDSISELAQKLALSYVNELKTCAIVCVRFEIKSWKLIFDAKGKVIFEVDPSLLKR